MTAKPRKTTITPSFLPSASDGETRHISVVIPAHNEQGNIGPLIDEILAALEGRDMEVIVVDDGSTDATAQEVTSRASQGHVRLIQHATACGQSAAIRTGVHAAYGHIMVTLDGDGQNNPADIPRLVVDLETAPRGRWVGMVAGQRVGRQDQWIKTWSSAFANKLRAALLQDGCRDTGCGLKAFRREAYLALPFFDHQHRFLPALMLREGFEVAYRNVSHRPRQHGRSKYGTLDRLLVSLFDMAGMVWLLTRRRGTANITEKDLGKSL
ncbi:MAG: glycosyltransferase family 2 protein [Alphaproteobacteria bacterium]|nr:glycosyltransferase family 2 protein [Alphaproteobacteria bacterium]